MKNLTDMKNKVGLREEWFRGKCSYCGRDIILLLVANEKFMEHCRGRTILGVCCQLVSDDTVPPTNGISVPDLVRVKSKTWYK